MPTQTVNIDKVEKQLAEILAAAASASEILIKQKGKPVARLTPINITKKKRIAGLNRGTIWTSPDFDEPLPDEFWSGKE
ncbi:MAG: toxin-antitoxin (TA) system antitoxin [Pyrinomonadaceae bacterium]